jgi:hypothetical protein
MKEFILTRVGMPKQTICGKQELGIAEKNTQEQLKKETLTGFH